MPDIAVGSRVETLVTLKIPPVPPHFPKEHIAVPRGTTGTVKEVNEGGRFGHWLHVLWDNGRIFNIDLPFVKIV